MLLGAQDQTGEKMWQAWMPQVAKDQKLLKEKAMTILTLPVAHLVVDAGLS